MSVQDKTLGRRPRYFPDREGCNDEMMMTMTMMTMSIDDDDDGDDDCYQIPTCARHPCARAMIYSPGSFKVTWLNPKQ